MNARSADQLTSALLFSDAVIRNVWDLPSPLWAVRSNTSGSADLACRGHGDGQIGVLCDRHDCRAVTDGELVARVSVRRDGQLVRGEIRESPPTRSSRPRPRRASPRCCRGSPAPALQPRSTSAQGRTWSARWQGRLRLASTDARGTTRCEDGSAWQRGSVKPSRSADNSAPARHRRRPSEQPRTRPLAAARAEHDRTDAQHRLVRGDPHSEADRFRARRGGAAHSEGAAGGGTAANRCATSRRRSARAHAAPLARSGAPGAGHGRARAPARGGPVSPPRVTRRARGSETSAGRVLGRGARDRRTLDVELPGEPLEGVVYAALLSSCSPGTSGRRVLAGAARIMFFSALCGTIWSWRPSSQQHGARPGKGDVVQRVDAAEDLLDLRPQLRSAPAGRTPTAGQHRPRAARRPGCGVGRGDECTRLRARAPTGSRSGSGATSGRERSRSTARRTATTLATWMSRGCSSCSASDSTCRRYVRGRRLGQRQRHDVPRREPRRLPISSSGPRPSRGRRRPPAASRAGRHEQERIDFFPLLRNDTS